MPKRLFSIGEVSRLSNVAAHRIHYAIRRGFIKAPVQLNGRRCFTPHDLERIREHFGIRVLSGPNHDSGVFTQ
jgi:DNA-binding transcriptional MerR regulator